MTQEAWEKQKALLIHQSHWMTGSVYMQQERWADADKSLRAALASTVPGSDLTEVLVLNLGWTSYKLRKIPEALKYYQQCVSMRGPNQTSVPHRVYFRLSPSTRCSNHVTVERALERDPKRIILHCPSRFARDTTANSPDLR